MGTSLLGHSCPRRETHTQSPGRGRHTPAAGHSVWSRRIESVQAVRDGARATVQTVTAQRADAGQRSVSGPGRPPGGFRAAAGAAGNLRRHQTGERHRRPPTCVLPWPREHAETRGRGARDAGRWLARGSPGRASRSPAAKTRLLNTTPERWPQRPRERLEHDAGHGTTTRSDFRNLGAEAAER